MFAGPNGSGKSTLIRKLSKDFAAEGLFQLHRYLNADDIHRELQEGRAFPLDFLGRAVTVEQLREVIIGGGRLKPNDPFLRAMHLDDSGLTADPATCTAYAAAAFTDFLRDELLATGHSFSFETVMSHRSKTHFFARARGEGYRTYLYFIATETAYLNIRRVQERTALGGHDVPEDKIVERYDRCLGLLAEALSNAHRAFLFDNSGDEPVWLAERTPEGRLELKVGPEALPGWFKKWVPRKSS